MARPDNLRRRRSVPFVRRLGQAIADSAAWIIALVVVYFAMPRQQYGRLEAIQPLIVISVHLSIALSLGLYQGRFWYGSSRELVRLYVSAVAAATVSSLVSLAGSHDRGHIASVGLATPLMLALAQVVRLVLYRRRRRLAPTVNLAARRLIVFGAGDGGEMALRALTKSPTSPFAPVAILDDDPGRWRLEIDRVKVMGGREDIGKVAQETGADAMLIAIPSASGETLRELTELGRYAALEVFVLPPVEEIFGGLGAGDIRPVTELDLLGRHPVDIDVATIAEFLTGRHVLVTGAGGSIGSELCRQVERFAPASLVMLDCDDSGLHGVQLLLEGRALLQSERLVLADIRDRERVFEVFGTMKPEVVFHAAALKHLSLLEQHPAEGWKTNVIGTQNVLDAALHHGVEHFVNVSTDKAADPICVLGWTKRIAERQTAHAALTSDRHYVSVRFGNVLGSRGSVLEIFDAQLAAGGPLTVTDERVTRYFMTVSEAVRLTMNAAAVGTGGEVLVLDMGQPVRIVDVARRIAAASSRRVEIVFTGLRPGEKLHECLLGTDEIDRRPHHPKISHVPVPPLCVADIGGGTAGAVDAGFIAQVASVEQLRPTDSRTG